MVSKRQARHLVKELIAAYERGDADDTMAWLLRQSLLHMEQDRIGKEIAKNKLQ